MQSPSLQGSLLGPGTSPGACIWPALHSPALNPLSSHRQPCLPHGLALDADRDAYTLLSQGSPVKDEPDA